MSGDQKSQQRAMVQEALSGAAHFLTHYLPLANTHAVDFIIHDAWNTRLPRNIQSELLALSEQQLVKLPSGCICPDWCQSPNDSHEEETQSCECRIADKQFEEVGCCTDKLKAGGSGEQCCDTRLETESESSHDQCLQKGAESSHESLQKGAELSHESLQKGAELSHESLQKGAELSHESLQKGAESSHESLQKGAELSHESLQKGSELSHESLQKGAESSHESLQKGTESSHESLQKGAESSHESKAVVWPHSSLRQFLAGVRRHCVDQLICLKDSADSLGAWLHDTDSEASGRKPLHHDTDSQAPGRKPLHHDTDSQASGRKPLHHNTDSQASGRKPLHHNTDSQASGRKPLHHDTDSQAPVRKPFVHAFMNEKKMHEVEIMADLCAEIFRRSSADIVMDLGSGKGYLSTQLSLQCRLPVIGIDSQPHNTSGAAQRAVKLERRWESLVRHEQKKLEKETVQLPEIHQEMTEKCSLSVGETSGTAKGQPACVDNGHGLEGKSATGMHDSGSNSTETESKSNMKLNICQKNQKPGQRSTHQPDNNNPDMVELPRTEVKQTETETQTTQSKVTPSKNTMEMPVTEETQTATQTQTRPSKTKSKNTLEVPVTEETQTNTQTQTRPSKAPPPSRGVAVTMVVSPATRLVEVVREWGPSLSPHTPTHTARLLLAGLHTCGALAPSMLRLFVRDAAVRTMCGVGCCYQLMRERFGDCAGDWQDHRTDRDVGMSEPEEGGRLGEGDFPLSSALLDRRMAAGRVALNVASLSLQRMTQSSAQLQGKTYYPRALLQAFIHRRLGYIPGDLRKLRKLARQARDPVDYVTRAIAKLNIPGCQATEEEVRMFHMGYSHVETQMAAFFQLRAALAPVIEAVVQLDRLLYLLEQDCVDKAFLVRLFDPVTSPRCHAIIAVKRE